MKAFDKKIKLYTETTGYGHTPTPEKINAKVVWCHLDNVGATVSITATYAGMKLEKEVIMWSREYGGQNRVEISGKPYKVEKSVKTGADNTIKLLLSAG